MGLRASETSKSAAVAARTDSTVSPSPTSASEQARAVRLHLKHGLLRDDERDNPLAGERERARGSTFEFPLRSVCSMVTMTFEPDPAPHRPPPRRAAAR